MTGQLGAMWIYPIKALDPMEVKQARLLPSGPLEFDRAWAIFDRDGNFVNGKRNPKVHGLAARYDLRWGVVELGPRGVVPRPFDLRAGNRKLDHFLSDWFGQEVELRHNPESGFPDDTKASGPTLISSASLEAVKARFPELDPGTLWRRFRPNLRVDGVPAFWEDRLFGKEDTLVRFRIGEVEFQGSNPCQRCVVPPRDPDTGGERAGFQKEFTQWREESLPEWAERSRFNHFYRFMLNTRLPEGEGGKTIRVGDEVSQA